MTDPVVPETLLDAVDLLAPTFAASDLDEIEVEVGELHVRLARSRSLPRTAAEVDAPGGRAPATPAAVPLPLMPFGEPQPGMRFVVAPLTGVWYSAPSPGARPYVIEGAEISAGQVVGLIEAMKLFNEIKSDVGGRVARMLVEDGTLVKRQQPILEIDPR